MTTLLYLFALGGGVDPADYEAWAAAVDLPRLRALPSVRSYRILRVATASGPHTTPAATAGAPPCAELIAAATDTADLADP